jgi:hypothetical protein
MLKNLFGLGGDLVKLAVVPVEVAAGVARQATKPISDLAEDVIEEIADSDD